MPAVDLHDEAMPASPEHQVNQADPAPVETVAQPAASDDRRADGGFFGAIRNGALRLAGFIRRLKTNMSEADSLYRETWNGGRIGAAPDADAPIPHSTTARILSETGEWLADATMREDANGSALLRLDAPGPLPARAVIQTPDNETGRVATVKWTGDASAIVEFDQ
jgi:hypothetical protein